VETDRAGFTDENGSICRSGFAHLKQRAVLESEGGREVVEEEEEEEEGDTKQCYLRRCVVG